MSEQADGGVEEFNAAVIAVLQAGDDVTENQLDHLSAASRALPDTPGPDRPPLPARRPRRPRRESPYPPDASE